MIQDKQGCYRVGDLKFYSKIEAIEAMQKTGIHLHWDFNEAVYSSYDWKKEPAESLPELYKRRALQLREKYDYIALCYSGGADSQNALDTFLDNNIRVDELVSLVDYELTGETHNFLNAEIFEVVIPKVKEYQLRYPWLKHRLYDHSTATLKFYSDRKHRYDWFYSNNTCLSASTAIRDNWAYPVKEWMDLIEAGKKVCFLWGIDKPRVCHINGKFIFRFLDTFWQNVSAISGKHPYTEEFFYWTPDLPEIAIKQGHVIKNYLSLPNVKNLPFVTTEKSDLAWREIEGKKYWLSVHGVHTLVYPKWDITTFSVGKSPSSVISPRDSWFYKIENSHPAKSNWLTGYEKLSKMLPEYWMNDPKDMTKNIKGCWSKDYFLN